MNTLPKELQRPSFPLTVTHRSALLSLGTIAVDWLLIAAAIALHKEFPNPLTLVFSLCVIAARQHALFLVMHEGAHGHLLANKVWNQRISNLFAAWPIGLSTERFRNHHWIHHNHTNTEKDPDWVRKVSDPHWQFPKTTLKFWKDFLPYFAGRGVLEMSFAMRIIGLQKKDIPAVALYYGAIAAALTYYSQWHNFFLYWALPYYTILPIFNKVRSIIEHLALPNTNPLNGSRNIIGTPVESFFFGPHANTLHLIHHLYPYIPWYRLAAAREFLLQFESYKIGAHENVGYFLPNPRAVYKEVTINRTQHNSDNQHGGYNERRAA